MRKIIKYNNNNYLVNEISYESLLNNITTHQHVIIELETKQSEKITLIATIKPDTINIKQSKLLDRNINESKIIKNINLEITNLFIENNPNNIIVNNEMILILQCMKNYGDSHEPTNICNNTNEFINLIKKAFGIYILKDLISLLYKTDISYSHTRSLRINNVNFHNIIKLLSDN